MSESSSGQPSETSAAPSGAVPAKEPAPFELSQEPVTPEGEQEPGTPPAPPAPAYEHLGELPATYGTQSVYLVAYDPRQLFVYWDVDWTAGPDTPYALHLCQGDGSLEQQADIVASEAGRYLAAGTPGGTYYVELGKYGRDGRWQVVATSSHATLPPAGLADDTEPQFATLPFHLTFQRLMELIHDAVDHREDLTAALARLQRGSEPGPLHALESLLEQRFEVSSGGASSPAGQAAAPPLHRDRRDVLSASAFGSEAFSQGPLTAGLAGGSEALSSGAFGGLPGGSASLAAYAAGLSSESLSSFGLGSEAWHLAAGADGSGSGGFGGPDARERADQLLRSLEHHLRMFGGLFSGPSSGSGSGGG